jgi:Tol biopolymer transport system component
MRSVHPARSGALVALCVSLAASCFDMEPFESVVFQSGAVRITVITTGQDLDPDGYVVLVDEVLTGGRSINANGTLVIGNLRTGIRVLTLVGVAPNCALANGSRSVAVSPNDTIDVAFTSSCSNMATLRVTVETTGVDPDPDGHIYTMTARLYHSFHVEANKTLAQQFAAGEYVFTLTDVAANCDLAEPRERNITLVSGDTVALVFHLTCSAVTPLAFALQGDIYVIKSNGTGMTRLTNGGAVHEDPAWSPDGRRIAVTTIRGGNRDIEVMNADGTGAVRLTNAQGADHQPDWSPDGSRIVFVSERDGNAELYVMRSDGTDPVRLTNDNAIDTDPAWSPNGSQIAFTSERDGDREIHVMNVDGSGTRRITTFEGTSFHPAWSPDGTRLAFARKCLRSDCVQTIAVVNADGSGLTTTGFLQGEGPNWSPDGRKIAHRAIFCDYYYGYGCTFIGIWVARLDGASDRLASVPGAGTPSWRR